MNKGQWKSGNYWWDVCGAKPIFAADFANRIVEHNGLHTWNIALSKDEFLERLNWLGTNSELCDCNLCCMRKNLAIDLAITCVTVVGDVYQDKSLFHQTIRILESLKDGKGD
jgi:hypothetical protein